MPGYYYTECKDEGWLGQQLLAYTHKHIHTHTHTHTHTRVRAPDGFDGCLPCAPGTFSLGSVTSCTLCANGKYAENANGARTQTHIYTCTTICQNNARRHTCTHKRLDQTIHSWNIYLQSLKQFWMLAPQFFTLCITHCAHLLTLEANACVSPASTCLTCAAGKSSPTNATQCYQCAAGWHNAVDGGECTKCISRVSPVGATGAVSP
jgi:hypothetical protein